MDSNNRFSVNQESAYAAKYFLAAIVESSQDSVVSIDTNRIITTWNKAAEYLYGYEAREVIGKSLEMVMLPKDIVDLIENIDKISHEIAVPIYETVRLHKNGKQADLQIALSPVRNALGEVIGISTIARDITEAKLQEQLKDEFIAVASHELKTPLTSMKGFAEMLLQALSTSADHQQLSMMGKLNYQIDRMIELIRTLLDTTRLSAGQVLLHVHPFDICALIEEQVEIIRRVSAKHSIRVNCTGGHLVEADRKLIGQVISNLISNAVKYSPDGGQIIVSSELTDHLATVKIQDFGMGIAEEQTHKIFERYFRVSSGKNANIPGIGLGLYITAQIIHQHGGTINVESTEGKGSIFSFELPLTTLNPTAT